MADQVLAFDGRTVPQAQLFVHGATDYAAVLSHRTRRYPVRVAEALAEELADLLACAQVIQSEPVVRTSCHDLLGVSWVERQSQDASIMLRCQRQV